ncbi:hypothetical protein [Streptomyces fradiae]|uniref:hypothetical protein n=1 Tax=Streptomyces fradiae TaxID=1906 RepID=UPI003654EA7C
MRCPRCGGGMSRTAGGSWYCVPCGYTQLGASAAIPADVSCPRCADATLHHAGATVRCRRRGCAYELDAEAFALFCRLVAELDADGPRFFHRVAARTAELRAREPYWLSDTREPLRR